MQFGSRLRTARKMAGMSLADLAGRLGWIISRQAISKYETGRMKPSPFMLERLTETLGIKPPFEPILQSSKSELKAHWRIKPGEIRGERIIELERCNYDTGGDFVQIRFRERWKLAAKTAAALKFRLEDYVKRCLEVESSLGIAHKFGNPLSGRAFLTAADVETAAFEARRAWGLGSNPVTNLLGLLEEKGIRVFEVRAIEGFEGLSGNFGSVPFIIVNQDFSVDRVRFTAAHELGHVLCGFPERESAESLCHAFAAAFLLPREAVEKALMPARRKISFWELKELKESYGISLQAIMYRARVLGIVTARQLRNFRETVRANDWLVKEPVQYEGKERTTRLRRLLSYAVAESIMAPGRAAEILGVSQEELLSELGNIF
jgi:Zn-dependent peptidase ImmA (M78 family)/transcriptional regulator with XRE-family HTH domain